MIELTDASEHDEPASTAVLFNGVHLNTRVIPAAEAARGGDWCETLVLSADVIALSIGDVCGHGPEKFGTMKIVRQTIRDAARNGRDPSQTLASANAALRAHDPDETATALFAVMDTRRRILAFANAGHPPLLMVGPLGALFVDFADHDIPLGIEDTLEPALRTVNAPPATLFVLYTDGVTDGERMTARGEAQLLAAAQTTYRLSAMPAADVVEELMLLTGSNRDDAAILTARTPAVQIERRAFARRRIDDRKGGLSAEFATMPPYFALG